MTYRELLFRRRHSRYDVGNSNVFSVLLGNAIFFSYVKSFIIGNIQFKADFPDSYPGRSIPTGNCVCEYFFTPNLQSYTKIRKYIKRSCFRNLLLSCTC